MRLWPWSVDNKTSHIIVAFTALAITIILATIRAVSISCGTICRDFVMLGLHLTSALSVAGFILLHAEFRNDDLELCQLSNSFQYSGEYLRLIFSLCVFWLRLNALIGPVYPKWIRYPTLLPITLTFMFLCWLLNTNFNTAKGAFIDDSGICREFRSGSSFLITDDTCIILSILQGLPSIFYLTLFILPLLKYQDDVLGSIIRKHIAITAVDIIVELICVVLVFSSQHMVLATYWTVQMVVYGGLIVSNIMLIFVFADWRKYFCIRGRYTNRGGDKGEESSEAKRQISLQPSSIQEPLLP